MRPKRCDMDKLDFSRFPVIISPRLVLRPIWGVDLAALYALRSDAQVNHYLDRPLAQNEDEVKEFMIRIHQGQEREENLYWVITSLETATLMGAIGLWNFSNDRSEAEIGFELFPHFQRQGIMAEALGMVLLYAFTRQPFEIIRAFTQLGNEPSIRLLEKQGFIPLEGQIPSKEGLLQFYLKSQKKVFSPIKKLI